MAGDFLSLFRSCVLGSEPKLARMWQARMADNNNRHLHEERLRFEKTLNAESSERKILLGRTTRIDGSPSWIGVPRKDFLGMHAWVTGATGSGKSFFVLGCLLQVLENKKSPVILLDMKGELADLVLDIALPVITQHPNGQWLLDNLKVVRPFDRQFLPELRITLREDQVPIEVQAVSITAAIEEALGDSFGQRMSRVFHKLVGLAIERNEPLTVVQSWLEQPELFSRSARESRDPTIR